MNPRFPVVVLKLFAVFGVASFVLSAAFAAQDDDEPKKKKEQTPEPSVYAGQFINRKTGARGPIKAHLTPSEDGPWSGKFDGVFKGSPFEYNVEFDATVKSKQTDLSGKATVDGTPYTWKGLLKGDAMNIDYKASNGFNGNFTLKKTSAKTPPKKKK
jgi:hypothetical protein